ncbi:ELMO domain-containing protein C-like [Drosophila ananassae]|uniref:ELMO domain-containing protein C-like n=1 Tax=Drosophila ananassae TaxID=7217 RepID=UPI001CFFCB0A|nr:ELMO domain-containing protein C-like [Drosophila ananassae]
MKYLFVVALIALAIQLAASTGTSTTTTEASTTTTTTTAADSTTTTTESSSDTSTTSEKTHRKKLCWRGNNWCGTFIPKRKRCKNGKCRRVVVRVTRRKTA